MVEDTYWTEHLFCLVQSSQIYRPSSPSWPSRTFSPNNLVRRSIHLFSQEDVREQVRLAEVVLTANEQTKWHISERQEQADPKISSTHICKRMLCRSDCGLSGGVRAPAESKLLDGVIVDGVSAGGELPPTPLECMLFILLTPPSLGTSPGGRSCGRRAGACWLLSLFPLPCIAAIDAAVICCDRWLCCIIRASLLLFCCQCCQAL